MTMATRTPAPGAGDRGPRAAVRFCGLRRRGPRATCYRLRRSVNKSLERLARAVEPFSHPLDKMTFWRRRRAQKTPHGAGFGYWFGSGLTFCRGPLGGDHLSQ